jgi:hypothetical protein
MIFDYSDVKDRSVLKIIQLNNNPKPHVSFKEPEIDQLARPIVNGETTYQRLSRPVSVNGPIEEKSTDDNLSRSLSEPRRETSTS